MAVRICLVPVVGTGIGSASARRPKYFADGGLPTRVEWGGTDYGFEPWMIVSADLDAGNVTFLQAQADASLIPEALDATLSAGQVTATQTYLEAMHLPAEWVTTAFTWRTVIRTVLGVFRFMARYAAVYAQATGSTAPIFTGGVDLTRTVGSLALPVRTALSDTSDQLGLDRSGVTGATTLRQLLRDIGAQMAAVPQGVGAMVV